MTAIPIVQGSNSDDAAVDDVGRPVLVVGVDGTAPSWDAFAWAAGEARRSDGRIVAVFATALIEPEEAFGTTAPLGYAVAEETRDQMAEQLAAEVATRGEALGVEVSFVRGTGDATRVLTEVAHSKHADLIVIGRSQKMLHRLAGSVGRRLVLNRQSPVLVVVP
jgi:nucleotide-binding universal stress UspA family protein